MRKKISAAIHAIQNSDPSPNKNLQKQTTQRKLDVNLEEVYCGKKRS